MPPALPTTEVFAFSAPKSNAGELLVAMNLGVGVQHVLHATRAVWQNLFERLRPEFAPESLPVAAGRKTNRPYSRHHPRLTGEERFARYYPVLTRIERTGLSRRQACEEANIAYAGFTSWLHDFKRTGYRGPALKPGGKIL